MINICPHTMQCKMLPLAKRQQIRLYGTMSAKLKEGLEHTRAMRYQQAADAYREVLRQNPEHADAMHFLGLALWNITQDPQEPLKLIRKSMQLAPDQPQMHHNLASVLGSLDQMDEAIKHYRRAIELKPAYAEAFFNLGGIYKFRPDDPLIAEMQTIYAGNNCSNSDQEYLCFALSKAMNDTAKYHEAFHFALEASRLRSGVFKAEIQQNAVNEAIASLNRSNLARNTSRGDLSEAPVFIIGMPRSGTTLVETILSRHPDVFAAGELPMIGSVSEQMRQWAVHNLAYKGTDYGYLLQMPDEHFNSAARACMGMVNQRAKEQKFIRFTDKMPQNAYKLAQISMLFPNARVIHVRRHPLDTCISCFFQRFRTGHEYSYRLQWLGRYYRQYSAIMDHWKKTIPLPIMEVAYEDIVRNPETNTRKLIEFSGLEWSNSCLEPQKSDRAVMTASRWQVRQPIYKTSLERWKRYQPWLQPLIDALGGMEWINDQAPT